jgi:hypothetical protein
VSIRETEPPHKITRETALIPPASWWYLAEIFVESVHINLRVENNTSAVGVLTSEDTNASTVSGFRWCTDLLCEEVLDWF